MVYCDGQHLQHMFCHYNFCLATVILPESTLLNEIFFELLFNRRHSYVKLLYQILSSKSWAYPAINRVLNQGLPFEKPFVESGIAFRETICSIRDCPATNHVIHFTTTLETLPNYTLYYYIVKLYPFLIFYRIMFSHSKKSQQSLQAP